MLRSNSTRSGECAESVLTRRAWISSEEADCFAHSRYVVKLTGWWRSCWHQHSQVAPTDRQNFRLALIHLVFMICLSLCLSVSREFLQQQQQLLHANSPRVTSFLIRHYCIPIYTVGLLTAELLAVSEHCRNSLWQNSVTLSSSIKTLTDCK